MPRGTTGLSAVESKRLEGARWFFINGLKGYAWGKKCRAYRPCRHSRAAQRDRYRLTVDTPLTGKLCQFSRRSWDTLRDVRIAMVWLTESP
jgi:hypothetical protein